MAEIKEENERAIYKSTLEEIIEKLNERLSKKNLQNIVILKEGKSIGLFTFNKDNEKRTKKLYSITMVIDGNEWDYIYDETGDRIARVNTNGEVIPDDDIRFERDGEGEEDANNRFRENMRLSQPFQNDNQGRHIADRKEQINLSAEEKEQQKSNIEGKNNLTNLIDIDVEVDSSAAIIDLYRTIYNGRRLRDMLAIDQKLKDRLPEGINIEHLNFMGVVNSDQLTAKDGKQREADATCVIMDDPRNPKQMIELDTSILKPRANLSKQENMTSDKTSQHLGDAEIKKDATATTNTRQISTFEIPDAGENISQPNDMITLEIRQNSKYIDESTSQRNNAHNIEFYIGIQDKSKSENEQKHGLKTQSIKIEAYDETNRVEEFEMQRAFRNDYGVDDEFENKKTIQGIDRNQERDAEELNQQMVHEEKEHNENINKKNEIESNINGEIANQVNEREHYMKMAEGIAKNSDTYGINDVYAKIMKVKDNNQELNDEQLQAVVQQELEDEKVLGDSSNPRRMM